MVHVTGGEPLLRRDLFAAAKRIDQLGFPWGMVTNGTLITDEVVERMRETHMRTVSVSIDDLYEAHEKVRRLPGAFPRIIAGIEKLSRAGFLDVIQVTTVVTRRNISRLEEMLAFFSRLSVDSWRLAIVDPIGRAAEQTGLLLTEDDLERYFAFLDRHAFHPRSVLTTSCSHYLGRFDTLYRPEAFACEAGKRVASILADGSIFVCPNVPHHPGLIQGNIQTDDFVRVWENGFRWFRDEENRKTGACAQCPDWKKCKGDSLHTWNFESGRPNFCIRRCGSSFCAADAPGGRQAPAETLIRRLRDGALRLKRVRISYGSSSGRTVYFSPAAADELAAFFHWGRMHPVNIREQMAAAVGYWRGEDAWVEELIPVPLENRDRETASFGADAHDDILRELALMNDGIVSCPDTLTGGTEQVRLLGYMHSHPGALPPVMSAPDLEFHNMLARAGVSPLLNGIVNPQRGEMCFYRDSVYSPCDVILFVRDSDVEIWTADAVPSAETPATESIACLRIQTKECCYAVASSDHCAGRIPSGRRAVPFYRRGDSLFPRAKGVLARPAGQAEGLRFQRGGDLCGLERASDDPGQFFP